jgi:hypothetical protein
MSDRDDGIFRHSSSVRDIFDPPGLLEFHLEVYGGDVATNGNSETTRERSELTCARPEPVHLRARKDGISAIAMESYDPVRSACGRVSGSQGIDRYGHCVHKLHHRRCSSVP